MIRRRAAWWLVTVVGIGAVVGCTDISVLSGPRTLSAGDTAAYVLSLSSPGTDPSVGSLYVLAEVPEAWSLLSNAYEGTIGGVPVSGSGTVVGPIFGYPLPAVADGFQRLWVQIDEGPADPTIDSGEMHLEFEVTEVPEGEFVLKFWLLAGGGDGTLGWGPPAYAVINREPHVYKFAGALAQVDGALDDNRAVASSSDGRSVVLGGGPRGDISVVDRDPLTGALNPNHRLDDASLSSILDLAFAPGDHHVYGIDGSHLACFQRNAVNGRLSVSQILEDNVGGVDGLGGTSRVGLSPDGTSVYASAYDDDAVSVFARDPSSGDLSFLEANVNNTGGITGMNGPRGLAVSPDGAHVYVSAPFDRCIVVFDRDDIDGTLIHSQTICGVGDFLYPESLAVSPDGDHVYSADIISDSVAVFARDPASGQLTFEEVHVEGIGSVVGLYQPTDLALSPDGRYVFVSASRSLVVFSRDPASGSLSFLNADFDQEGGVIGMSVPYQLAVSADGSDLFYASHRSMAVFTVRTFADGFESGDTSGWSSQVP